MNHAVSRCPAADLAVAYRLEIIASTTSEHEFRCARQLDALWTLIRNHVSTDRERHHA